MRHADALDLGDGAPPIPLGGLVAVRPPERARRFVASVTRVDVADDGRVVQVHVAVRFSLTGDLHRRAGSARCVFVDRVDRLTPAESRRLPRL